MLDDYHDHFRLFIGMVLAALSAITLAQWAIVTTILYTVLQIGLLVPRYVAMFRGWKKRRPSNDA